MIAKIIEIFAIFGCFRGVQKSEFADHKGIVPLTEKSAEQMGADVVTFVGKLPENRLTAETDVGLFELDINALAFLAKGAEGQKLVARRAA